MNSSLSYKDWKKITSGVQGSLKGILLAQWELVATSVFEWKFEGLEDIDLGRHIERYLYRIGSVVFFEDNRKGFGVLPYAQQAGLNWYGEPVNWKVVGANGYNKDLNIDNSVLIRANKLRISNFGYVNYQVSRLVDIENTINVNVNQLKVPFVFSGNEDVLLTLKNFYKKVVNNEPAVYLDKKLDFNAEFKVLPTNVNYFGDELNKLYNDFEGRILKVLGLKYVHTEKKERLIVDEVNSNDGLTNTFLYDALKERQNACEKIKEIFNINVSVDINPLLKLSNPEKDDEGNEDNVNEGGVDNE